MEVVEIGDLRKAHGSMVEGHFVGDENLPECGMIISCTREELQNMKQNPIFRSVTLNVGKSMAHLTLGSFNITTAEESYIEITWDGERMGEKKDYKCRFKVIDTTHVFGTAPHFRGMWRCCDTWHTYYLPNKDCIKMVKKV